mmetsp:Transcript_61318/g.164698  ORF Transcript_61318/g.164698 Transcript_61318/m.164698 type:complete len:155 (+) Transcript_61318:183-647(+)
MRSSSHKSVARSSQHASSYKTTSSRSTLYKQFDKLTKEEQIVVLKDALESKDRLDMLETESTRFSDIDLKGLTNEEKAKKLIRVLGSERQRRIQKESAFMEMLQEERVARKQAEENMRSLEMKLDALTSLVQKKGTKLPLIKTPSKAAPLGGGR